MKLLVYLFVFSSFVVIHAAEEKEADLPALSFGPFAVATVRTHVWKAPGTPAGKAELRSPFPNDFPPSITIGFEDARPYPAYQKGARYFFPARNYLRVYRIAEVERAPYQTIQKQIASLRKLLREKPDSIPEFSGFLLPDYPPRNATHVFQLKLAYLEAPWGSGLCYLTQFTQEAGHRANNEELTYLFQGLTKDGKYYLSADLRVMHPKLPKGIDDVASARGKRGYLDEDQLSTQPDKAFTPSLLTLRQWLQSIRLQ